MVSVIAQTVDVQLNPAAISSDLEEGLSRELSDYQLYSIDASEVYNSVSESQTELNLRLWDGAELILDVQLEKNEILDSKFRVTYSSGLSQSTNFGKHFIGRETNESESFVSVSLFEDELACFVSTDRGDYKIERLNRNTELSNYIASNIYLMYSRSNLLLGLDWSCGTSKSESSSIPVLFDGLQSRQVGGLNGCVRVFLDCDNDLYELHGGSLQNYVLWLFNTVSGIYSTDVYIDLTLSELHIWDTDDPFDESNSDDGLSSFIVHYEELGYSGDIASLLTFDGGAEEEGSNGGKAAGFGTLCQPELNYNYSDLTIRGTFITGAWEETVIAHELGHNLGSRHTHWCGWSDGAIDNCASVEPEPFGATPCTPGPQPTDGGTIMSYCFLDSDIGTSFADGFAEEPATVIASHVYQSQSCVIDCDCNDRYEHNDSGADAYRITDRDGVLFDNEYDYHGIESYICDANDVDHFKIEIAHRGVLSVTLSSLPANYQLEIYKDGALIDGSFNGGTEVESAQYIRSTPVFSNQEIEIVVYGYNGANSSSNSYELNLQWAPLPSWLQEHLSFTQVAYADVGENTFFNISGNTEICQGQSTQLTASGCNGANYVWIPADGLSCSECPNPVASPAQTTTYTVIATDVDGNVLYDDCLGQELVTVNVSSGITANAGPNLTINQGSGVNLQGSGGSTYSWSPSSSLNNANIWNPYATPTTTTTYTLTVTDGQGCSDQDQMTVTVNGGGGGGSNPPYYDDPCDARTLNVYNSCSFTTGTNIDATDSGVNSPSTCAWSSSSGNSSGNYQGGDVWFKLTVPSSGEFIVETQVQSSVTDLVLTFYSGSCSNLSEITCNDDQVPGSNYMPWYHMTNRSPGETIWVRAFEFGNNVEGNFGICAYNPNSGGGGGISGPDLVSSIDWVSNTNPDAGETITVDYSVSNNGDQDVTEQILAVLLFSDDPNSDPADEILLGSHELINGINAGATVNLTKQVDIPNEPDGGYYIVSNPDVTSDASEVTTSNNYDSELIYIGDLPSQGPNLEVLDVDVLPSSGLAPGQVVDVEVTIENNGDEDAGTTYTRVAFDLNDNGVFDSGTDPILETITLPSMDVGEVDTRDRDVVLPMNIPSTGTYKIFAVADIYNDEDEIDESDNIDSDNVSIGTLTPAGPDLVSGFDFIEIDSSNVLVSSTDLCLDVEYDFHYTVTNVGNLEVSTGGSQIRARAYISDDQILNGYDEVIDVSGYNGSQDVGEVKYLHDDEVLVGFSPGPHYLLFRADANEDVAELNEGNNISSYPIFINGCGVALADVTGQILTYSPYSSALGDSITMEVAIWNQGDVCVSGFDINGYISEDQQFDSDGSYPNANEDFQLEEYGQIIFNDTICPGDTVYLTISGWSNSLNSTGTNYLFLAIDADRDINESNKDNNFIHVPINITSVDCFYNVYPFDPDTGVWSYDQQFGDVKVWADEDCDWVANGLEEWIILPQNDYDSGIGLATTLLEDNPYPFPRTGHIDVSGVIHEFVQLGRPCELLDDSLTMDINATVQQLSCGSLAEIQTNVQDGFGPFQYSWSDGSSGANLQNISVIGEYHLTVTDDVGCSVSDTFEIVSGSSLAFSEDVILPSCTGTSDGQVELTPINGQSYNFSWQNGSTDLVRTGLSEGVYHYTAFEGNCTIVDSVVIEDPDPLIISQSAIVDAYCNGVNNGSIGILVDGGTPNYSFSWSNGQTSNELENLQPGIYEVVVQDDNGCSVTQSYNIGQISNEFVEIFALQEFLCQGDTLFANPSSGDFSWSDGASENFTVLADSGWYYVTRVNSSCISQDSSFISILNPVADFEFTVQGYDVQFTNNSIFGDSYEWDFGDGNTSVDAEPLHSFTTTGIYTVTLTAYNSVCAPESTLSLPVNVDGIIGIVDGRAEELSVNLFPNPTDGDLNYVIKNANELQMTMLNGLGQEVYSKSIGESVTETGVIPCRNFAPGVYFVRLVGKDAALLKRVVLQD